MVTSEEIEELIVEPHNGKNVRTESKHEGVRKNFTFIGAVLKRFPEEYPDSEENKETEALKLFSEKKSPTEVAIKLGSSLLYAFCRKCIFSITYWPKLCHYDKFVNKF